MTGDWVSTKLGNVVELKRGYDLPQLTRTPGKVPLVSSSGVTDHHSKAMVKGPGVVTGRYGTLGQVFYIEDDFWPLNTTLYVRDFKGNDPRFISYLLRTLDFLAYSDKAAVPGLNRNHLHEAEVRIPTDLNEQRAIAHILSTVDDKIQLNQRMNQTLGRIARSIFKSWFVDFDPVRDKMEGRQPLRVSPDALMLFPDAFADSELGPIPQGWDVRPIGDVVRVVGGSTPSTSESSYWDGPHFFATPKDLSDSGPPVLLKTERTISDEGAVRISSGVLPIGTVLLSSRAPIGYVAIAGVPVAINQGFIAMVPDYELPTHYVAQWASLNVETFKQNAGGTTFAEINKGTFRPLPVLVPPQPLLDMYERIVGPVYERLERNLREHALLMFVREALLPKLISGEIRVDTVDPSFESPL